LNLAKFNGLASLALGAKIDEILKVMVFQAFWLDALQMSLNGCYKSFDSRTKSSWLVSNIAKFGGLASLALSAKIGEILKVMIFLVLWVGMHMRCPEMVVAKVLVHKPRGF